MSCRNLSCRSLSCLNLSCQNLNCPNLSCRNLNSRVWIVRIWIVVQPFAVFYVVQAFWKIYRLIIWLNIKSFKILVIFMKLKTINENIGESRHSLSLEFCVPWYKLKLGSMIVFITTVPTVLPSVQYIKHFTAKRQYWRHWSIPANSCFICIVIYSLYIDVSDNY